MMPPFHTIAVAAAFAYLPTGAWAVYKCVGADGRTAYQSAPCPSTSKGSEIDASAPSGATWSDRYQSDGTRNFNAEIEAAAKAHEKAVRAIGDACDRRGVKALALGMPKEDALCVPGWRFPKTTNTTTAAHGVHEQVVYGGFGRYDSKPKYLYFQNGRLTAIQE